MGVETPTINPDEVEIKKLRVSSPVDLQRRLDQELVDDPGQYPEDTVNRVKLVIQSQEKNPQRTPYKLFESET